MMSAAAESSRERLRPFLVTRRLGGAPRLVFRIALCFGGFGRLRRRISLRRFRLLVPCRFRFQRFVTIGLRRSFLSLLALDHPTCRSGDESSTTRALGGPSDLSLGERLDGVEH